MGVQRCGAVYLAGRGKACGVCQEGTGECEAVQLLRSKFRNRPRLDALLGRAATRKERHVAWEAVNEVSMIRCMRVDKCVTGDALTRWMVLVVLEVEVA